jgi:hypothetical protein
MRSYLFIGGDKDSLSFPAPDDAESLQCRWSKMASRIGPRETTTQRLKKLFRVERI